MTEKSETPPPNGLPYALGAYLTWGFVPVYFKLLSHVPPVEIVAQRILWSIPLLLVIMAFRSQLADYAAIFRDRALLLNPLVNVLLGRMFLGERLRPMQLVAVAVAALGVAILIGDALDTLWVSVSLAFSFGVYGLIRKITPVGSVPGLAVETTLLAPVSLAAALWFASQGTGGFGDDWQTSGLLILAGAITAIPLLLFATAARRMSYASLGFVQYLAPSIAFLLGVFVYNEPLSMTKLACFILIWISIAIFCVDAFRTYRAGKA